MKRIMDIKFHCSEDEHFTKKEPLFRAFSFQNYYIEPHAHDFYEMNIVLSGSGIHQIEAVKLSVSAGDVFVIPPMTAHAYYNTENLEVFHIIFKKDFIISNHSEAITVPGFLQLMEIEPFLRQNCSEAMFLHLTPSQLSQIRLDLKIIEDESKIDKELFSAFHKQVVWKIIYHLAYLLHEQINNKKEQPSLKYNHQVLDTLEYIHHHFSDKITIEDLAKRVYLSRSTFLRSFQAVYGCSPALYLNQYRVKKAMELLESSKMSKTEISCFCGFYDLSHMERSIKKWGA
ncbi:MAG: helix-turn-helix domain-containing protein [Clostridia bacterium]|nr:helix-turn-helix domain-containing protein [Clostridia bacterium]